MSTLPGLIHIWKSLFLKITVLIFVCLTLPACSTNNQGKFELELISTVFGEIDIIQGETTIATVAINRNVTSSEYTPDINLSLLDPPEWLHYTLDDNPSDGDINLLKLMITKETTPGIYRLILHGAGNMAGQLVEDSVTFHIVVKAAQLNSNANNGNNSLQSNC